MIVVSLITTSLKDIKISQICPTGLAWPVFIGLLRLPRLLLLSFLLPPQPLLFLAFSIIKLEDQNSNNEDGNNDDNSKSILILVHKWLTFINDI